MRLYRQKARTRSYDQGMVWLLGPSQIPAVHRGHAEECRPDWKHKQLFRLSTVAVYVIVLLSPARRCRVFVLGEHTDTGIASHCAIGDA